MDNEDGSNSSYTYGGAMSPAPQSWNPALRPDHAAGDSAVPASRIGEPSPEIVPQSKPELETSQDEDDDLPTTPPGSAIPMHVINGMSGHEPNSDDDFFDRYGSGDVSASGGEATATSNNEDGVSGDALVSATQALHLSDHDSEADSADTTDTAGSAVVERGPEDEESSSEHPEDNYEHQGETTLLEDAMNESEREPLVADSEPAADEWDSSGEVFDLGGKPQDAPLETPLGISLSTPHAEASGTTVGDEVIGNTTVGGNTGEEIDWGNAEEQDFFGSVTASKSVEPQQPSGPGLGAYVVHNSDSKPAPSAEWDLALDDDFLPENEAPAFELDDDEGFLEDEPSEPQQQPSQPTQAVSTTADRYAPQIAPAALPAASPYGLQGPQFADFSQLDQKKSIPSTNIAYGAYNQPSPYQQQAARPTMPSSTQSFVDKAKGGYSSPYDLPEDIVKTRKRPAARTMATAPLPQLAGPPPRSSSMYGNPSVSASRPPPVSNMSASSLSPPTSGHSMQTQMSGLPQKPAAPSKSPSNDFFAELPVNSKPKLSSRYTQPQVPPHAPVHHSPPQLPSKERTASWSSLRNEILPDSDNVAPQFQQPEQLPVFPDQPSVPVRSNSLPVPPAALAPTAAARYSPAPPGAPPMRFSPAPPPAPAANARYSPAPPQVSQVHHGRYVSDSARPPVQSYAPRTSSPLAQHTLPQEQQGAFSQQHASYPPAHQTSHSVDGVPRTHFRSPLEGIEEQGPIENPAPPMTARSGTPPSRSNPSSVVGSPRKRTSYAPTYQPTNPSAQIPAALPPRAHSQSPSMAVKHPLHTFTSSEQPTSGYGLISPTSTFGVQETITNVSNIIPDRRQIAHDYECIPPSDERANDPLQRWKGHPVFKWGLGGTVVTSFPKQIPRYGGGASVPMMKCSPGEIKVQNMKDIFPLADDIARFPGPLKAKGKKKDVSAWLGRRIEGLEEQMNTPGLDQSVSAENLKRLEERTLLWKILQVFIDHDGHLEGNMTVEAAVKRVLSPDRDDSSSRPDGTFSTAADLVGISRTDTSTVQAEPIDPQAVEELRTLLTKGDREKAVWHAVDQRLWAHAMLLSSTLNKDIWKQVVQEFVRKEVKKVGRNSQALAVLYEIFAGNHEDCIDELVPASARAGFQMVSTDGAGQTQNTLQGLDKWRETLSLILNNRSDGDTTALLSLGRLLAGYGRVEAAHICFVFARSAAYIGGVDDAQSDIVLIGADHRQHPLDLGTDLEPILLTEVLEYGLSLSAQTGSHIIPHLQNYKLAHAYQLAEYGHKTEAQSYCDAIAAAMKSTTRISPYYNASFIASLDDLSKRLSQSPKDGSSSWISGNTPTLSPSQSNADMYGTYSGYGAPATAPIPGSSRYAPSNAYAPRTSLDQARARYEPGGRPSMESLDSSLGLRSAPDSYMPSPALSGSYTPSQPQFSPPIHQSQAGKSQSYAPLMADSAAPPSTYGSFYQPTPPTTEDPSPAFGSYAPPQASFDEQALSQPIDQAQSNGYEPPSNSYEPPAYQPYNPDEEERSPVDQQPRKKKSFMDDDGDDYLTSRAATLQPKQKSDSDRKADEAFRKAAETDAQREKEGGAGKKGGGWFGGWFKKDPNAAPGPVKAKLGEENSFYYDPELKKWVNKKAGATEASKPIATPPPPRGGPPNRSVSANTAMGPPSSLPNAMDAPLSLPPTSNPQRSSSMPPPMLLPGSRASTPGIPSDTEGGKPPVLTRPVLATTGPPSRPGTGMSTASSIDDLLGAPQARKGSAAKKKKGGRYVDVMAK
ncbi:Sec23-binding domain of Sec16-domain-containing protein [Massariosphaeria phaeospora]|uniref:Protein transport protein sec16 n=1 Tax=Massariosphaeria phaeospora TaxID=100035 RepID=A0A7C8MBZ1_9PLEO|nr:Sec23-binding domain of Sec16-domain-containing protein [Massariosphaeria phaeospora]